MTRASRLAHLTLELLHSLALDGVAQALRRGTGKTAAELGLELERKNRDLEEVVATLSLQM